VKKQNYFGSKLVNGETKNIRKNSRRGVGRAIPPECTSATILA
jgi:hypothetical protein